MELRLPKEIIEFLDKVRGSASRQGYIVSHLFKLKEEHEKE